MPVKCNPYKQFVHWLNSKVESPKQPFDRWGHRIVRAFAHLGKDQPIISAKTISAADRLHKDQRKNVAFRKCARARGKTYFSSAVPHR